MSNVNWSKQILDRLMASGVEEIIICPGARNAPFVEVLSKWQGGKLYSFFEERSAGFFALGRIAQTGRPVAVITTSGTAVANLLPPVVEAHYSGFPLIVVSADRPQNYRGTGSPQTIVQPGIFSEYAKNLGDWENGQVAPWDWNLRGPAHLNICFDEPLIDQKAESWKTNSFAIKKIATATPESDRLEKFSTKSFRPLILVGGLLPEHRESVLQWLNQQDCPIYCEGTSGLRGALSSLELQAAERSAKLLQFDSVIRVGRVPTLRLWRDLEKSEIPVLSVSDLPFSGLGRINAEVIPLEALSDRAIFHHKEFSAVLEKDRAEYQRLLELLAQFPKSEQALVNQISQAMEPEDSVYLGNSLPIREWDLASRRDVCFAHCFANRGTNGIDGQLSTFYGWAHPKTKNWAILGDLTTLYDLSGPWALRARPEIQTQVLILNNSGGQIFRPMFGQPLFENRHNLSFVDWSKMWGLSYSRWQGEGSLSSQIIEVIPNEEQTSAFRRNW